MRRSLLALGVLWLLSVSVGPAAAGPASPHKFRLKLRGDTLVKFDRAKLPPLPAGREWRLYGGGGLAGGLRVKGDGDAGPLRFVVAGSEMRERAECALTLDALDAHGDAPTTVEVVDDDAAATEQFVVEDDRVFGAVAAESPEVYAKRIPRWFLAKLEPAGSVEVPIAFPAPGPEADATVRLQVEVVRAHDGSVKLAAKWGARDLGTAEAANVPTQDSPFVESTLLRATFTCPVAEMPAAGTPLTITDRSDPLPPPSSTDVSENRGAVWIDRVRFEALMRPHAGPRILEPSRLRRRLADVDGTRLLVRPKPVPASIAAAKGADELILSTAVLLPGAKRLAEHRTRTGVRAAAIPWADLVQAYDAADAMLVRSLLWDLAAQGTKPRFVLFCGDATYDRTDLIPEETIPTSYAPTKYNGATASDRVMFLDDKTGGPAVGRLPFRAAAAMDAYVDRVIAAETKPPADGTRRLLQFVTSEGRFGPGIDGLIERLFRGIVATRIPAAYDVEITFASATSDYLWPPHAFNEKVIQGVNDGCLFHTYVGHGWWDGFDDLRYEGRRYPILRDKDADRIDVKGTPPVMFVIACTTARFDDPGTVSVGERILAQPHGPLAYWGATRVCHPVFNSMAGRQIAIEMFGDAKRRLGEIVRDAVDAVVAPKGVDNERAMIRAGSKMMAPGEDIDRLYVEGSWMYVLLGDPALRVPLPQNDLVVEAQPTATGFTATVRAPGLADGTEVKASVEMRRDMMLDLPPVTDLTGDKKDEGIRARHDRANEKALVRATGVAKGGAAAFTFEVPEAWRGKKLCVKAWAAYGGDVHQGAWTPPGWIDPGTVSGK